MEVQCSHRPPTLMEMTPQRPSRMWSPDRLLSVSFSALFRLTQVGGRQRTAGFDACSQHLFLGERAI